MGYILEKTEIKVCESIWGNRPPSRAELERRRKEAEKNDKGSTDNSGAVCGCDTDCGRGVHTETNTEGKRESEINTKCD